MNDHMPGEKWLTAWQERTERSTLSAVLGGIALSLVAGLLVTLAVTPVVGLVGVAANTGITAFESLPDRFDPSVLPEASTLVAKDPETGKEVELATFYDQDRVPVEWEDISQYVKDAVVGEEDPRFYSHGGVDVLASARALLQNAAGQNLSGASTVTMQWVRNVLIQEATATPDLKAQKEGYENATRQDMDRKLKEMRLAIAVEKKYSKDDILLGYLNIASFGRQLYGIEAAANYYYNTTAKKLTLAQSASLVAIVNNPSVYQPDIEENLPANKQRRDKILNSMYERGKITKKQRDEAIATEVVTDITPRVPGCNIAEQRYGAGHFCDYVQRYIKNDPEFGDSAIDREFNFSRGGYRIETTIDLAMQQAGNESTRATVPQLLDGIDIGSASSSVEVGTGKVRTMVQNRPFNNAQAFLDENPGYTTINYNTDQEMGGSNGFQIGSTFKPVTLAEWIRTGHSVRDIVNVNGRTVDYNSFTAKCMPGGVYGEYGSFDFSNDNLSIQGNQSVLTAIANSINGGLVSMQQDLDLCNTIGLGEKLGLKRASDLPASTEDPEVPAVPTLSGDFRDLSLVPSNVYAGVDEIAPIAVASAYAAFAGDGTVCTPVPIEKITDSDGKSVPFTKSSCTKALDPDVAAGVAYALEYTVTDGLARHAQSSTGVPHLAKTGTTDDVKDNWTAGASTKVATATWVGNVGPVQLADGSWDRVSTLGYGAQSADDYIWPAIMNVADERYGGDAFREPAAAATSVQTAQVPNVVGKSYDEAVRLLLAAGFSVVEGEATDSELPTEQIAKSDPAAGTEAPRGSTVTIMRSNGKGATVPDGLVGQTGESARSALNSAGFANVDFVCQAEGQSKPERDEVVSVDPAGGSAANKDTKVTLTLKCTPEDPGGDDGDGGDNGDSDGEQDGG